PLPQELPPAQMLFPACPGPLSSDWLFLCSISIRHFHLQFIVSRRHFLERARAVFIGGRFLFSISRKYDSNIFHSCVTLNSFAWYGNDFRLFVIDRHFSGSLGRFRFCIGLFFGFSALLLRRFLSNLFCIFLNRFFSRLLCRWFFIIFPGRFLIALIEILNRLLVSRLFILRRYGVFRILLFGIAVVVLRFLSGFLILRLLGRFFNRRLFRRLLHSRFFLCICRYSVSRDEYKQQQGHRRPFFYDISHDSLLNRF